MTESKDYQKRAKESLDKIIDEMDELKSNAKDFTSEQKNKFDHMMVELSKKKEVAQKKFKEISIQTGDAAKEMKHGFEKAKDALAESWQKAKMEYKSKTEKVN